MTMQPPNTLRQRDLDNHKRDFMASNRHGNAFLQFLRRSETEVWRVEQDTQDPTRWWLNIQLPPNSRELFDLPLELLVVFVERYTSVEPRLLSLIQQRLRGNARLEEGFAIVVNDDPNFGVAARRKHGQLALVDLQVADLADVSRDLRDRMADVLVKLDHFKMLDPVKESAGFFGRGADIGEIAVALNRGQSVGVFGLRKTGKTSLLNELLSRRRESGKIVAHLDLSTIVDNGAFEFRVRLVTALHQALSSSGLVKTRLRILNKAGDLKGEADDELVRRHWFRDVEALINDAPMRIELFIDEIDQAFPPRSVMRHEDAESVFRSLTQLRGLLQEADPGRGVTLACFGVDPALFERPIFDGRDNLLYKLVRLHWLAPMLRDEMNIMLRNLGKRMGVRFQSNIPIDRLFFYTGGHPLLARIACSQIVKEAPVRALPFYIDESGVERAFRQLGQGTVREQVADIMASFTEWFPGEAALVELLLSDDRDDQAFALEEIGPNLKSVEHAIAYGVLRRDLAPHIGALGMR